MSPGGLPPEEPLPKGPPPRGLQPFGPQLWRPHHGPPTRLSVKSLPRPPAKSPSKTLLFHAKTKTISFQVNKQLHFVLSAFSVLGEARPPHLAEPGLYF